MKASQQYVKDHDIIPTISFKDGKAHVVTIIQDKVRTINTDQGEKEGVAYKVMEEGTIKRFFTSSDSLIVKLAEIQEGESVRIEMKSRKTADGFINFYEVEKVKEGSKIAAATPDRKEVGKPFPPETDDIPIIEEGAGTGEPPSEGDEVPF